MDWDPTYIFINESFNRGGPVWGPTNQRGDCKYTEWAAIRVPGQRNRRVAVEQSE
jgi:hypothetical protein